MTAPSSDTVFHVSCPPGIARLLKIELDSLGLESVESPSAGVEVKGSLEDAYRACLWSRVATRVLWPIARFPAANEEALYEAVREIPWEDHLAIDSTLVVDGRTVRSAITHSHFASLKVKDGVVDRLRDRFGQRPSVDLQNPDLRINLYLFQDEATISVDLSGHGLHRRGYRQSGHQAPIRENLAAAILMQAGWQKIEGPLLDPMCGSGTFLVEGALMAAGIAPGIFRRQFGFQGWLKHEEDVWMRVRSEAERIRNPIGRPIIGYDQDPEAVALAKRHASRAGVGEFVLVEQRGLSSLAGMQVPAPGLLVTNPPYGKRMGEINQVRGLYGTLGERLKGRFPGWMVALFTGNPELCSAVRLRPRRSYVLDNGGIESKLVLYKMDSRGAAGELGERQEQSGGTLRYGSYEPTQDTAGDGENWRDEGSGTDSVGMFENRLRKNVRHFGRWARRQEIDCFRVYDADLPDFPFAVDLYSGADCRYAHVQVYERDQMDETKLAAGIEAVESVLEIPTGDVILKIRKRQRGDAQYERMADEGQEVVVDEKPARFYVNLTDYLDTGLFLDSRMVRSLIREKADGARFLNLFGYTGTATVHAALGGASSTTTVDLSNTYLDWARRNFDLNGIEGEAHQFVRADCLAWIQPATPSATERYDLIYLDPPTFSNSTSMDVSFDVQRDHVDLIERCLSLMTDKGTLIFSCNKKGFKLEVDAAEGFQVRNWSGETLPKDFERRRAFHHCYAFERE